MDNFDIFAIGQGFQNTIIIYTQVNTIQKIQTNFLFKNTKLEIKEKQQKKIKPLFSKKLKINFKPQGWIYFDNDSSKRNYFSILMQNVPFYYNMNLRPSVSDPMMLQAQEIIKYRQQRKQSEQYNQRIQQIYRPQEFNNNLQPHILAKIQQKTDRSQLMNFGMGAPRIPVPMSLMPWPMESQISMGFDFQQQKKPRILTELSDPYLEIQKKYESVQNLISPKQVKHVERSLPYIQKQEMQEIVESQKQKPISEAVKKQLESYKLELSEGLAKDKQVREKRIRQKSKGVRKDRKGKGEKKIRERKDQIRKIKNKIQNDPKAKMVIHNKVHIFIILYSDNKFPSSTIKRKIKGQLQEFQNKIENSFEEAIKFVLNNPKDLKLEIGQDKANMMSIDLIQDMLIKFLEALNEINPDEINPQLMTCFANLFLSYKFPQQSYYNEFEKTKITFNTEGDALGQLERNVSLMLVQMMLYLRILIKSFLNNLWYYHPDQLNSDLQLLIVRNQLLLSSIMHYYLLDISKAKKTTQRLSVMRRMSTRVKLQVKKVDADKIQTLLPDMLPPNSIKIYMKYFYLNTKKKEIIDKLVDDYSNKFLDALIQHDDNEKDEKQRLIEMIEEYVDDDR
ncbi:hypothetical protein pb186bvf_002657 [Paramecium bursaria]